MQKGEPGFDYPRPGDRRWSDFFKSNIQMVEYHTDNMYYFVVEHNPKYPPEQMLRNKSPWSMLGPPHE